MNLNLRAIALSAIIMTTGLQAEILNSDRVQEIEPLQAHVTSFPEYTAVVYYAVLVDGSYEVVTTYAPNETVLGVSTRQRITMAPGQSISLSLDQGVQSGPASELKITALPTSIEITR